MIAARGAMELQENRASLDGLLKSLLPPCLEAGLSLSNPFASYHLAGVGNNSSEATVAQTTAWASGPCALIAHLCSARLMLPGLATLCLLALCPPQRQSCLQFVSTDLHCSNSQVQVVPINGGQVEVSYRQAIQQRVSRKEHPYYSLRKGGTRLSIERPLLDTSCSLEMVLCIVLVEAAGWCCFLGSAGLSPLVVATPALSHVTLMSDGNKPYLL